jgi:hypothetical protein
MLLGQAEGIRVACGQKPLSRLISPEDWSKTVNDGTVWEAMRTGNHSLARADGSKRPTLFFQRKAGDAVYGSGHSPTTAQLSVRGVDDGIHIGLACDISSNTFNRNAVTCSLHDEDLPLVLHKPTPRHIFPNLAYSRPGFYLGVGGLYAIEDFDNTLGLEFENGPGFNFRLGYRMHPNIAVEAMGERVDAFDLKGFSGVEINTWVGTLNGKFLP